MTKQVINVGSGELAGDGESLRSAFQKTNENFTELYNTIVDISDLTVENSLTVNTPNGTLHIRGSEPPLLGLNPNDAPHIHIEANHPEFNDLFLGDDSQFIRLATDGSVIINARLGAMAPAVVKGSDGVLINNGTAISNISTADTNVIVTVVDHGLFEGDKLYIEEVGGSVELNNNSYYVTNVVGNDFELLDTDNNPVLSSSVTAWTSGGIIYSASRGGDVIINAGGLNDDYGDEGVVEVYGKTVSITTQSNNIWMFDGINLTLPDGGDILDSSGQTVLGGGGGSFDPNQSYTFRGNNSFYPGNTTIANLILTGSVQDGNSSIGTAGQILSSTGGSVNWINPPSGLEIRKTAWNAQQPFIDWDGLYIAISSLGNILVANTGQYNFQIQYSGTFVNSSNGAVTGFGNNQHVIQTGGQYTIPNITLENIGDTANFTLLIPDQQRFYRITIMASYATGMPTSAAGYAFMMMERLI